MTITFFSNFFNHHQKPLCDMLHQSLGNGFTFVSSIKMPENFVKAGYADYSDVSYNLPAFLNDDNYEKAMELGEKSDIVVIGAAPDIFIRKRLKHNKHTFWYAERFLSEKD